MNPIKFLGEVKSELAKVIWPSRREMAMYTIAVIVLSLIVAIILGIFDFGLLRLFEFVLNR